MPRMNQARWFGRYACMHSRIAQRRLDHACIGTCDYSGRDYIALVSLSGFLRVNWILTSFFSCFHGRAGGEDGCVYKLLLFLSSRHHALVRGQSRTQAIRGWPGPFADNLPHAKSHICRSEVDNNLRSNYTSGDHISIPTITNFP